MVTTTMTCTHRTITTNNINAPTDVTVVVVAAAVVAAAEVIMEVTTMTFTLGAVTLVVEAVVAAHSEGQDIRILSLDPSFH